METFCSSTQHTSCREPAVAGIGLGAEFLTEVLDIQLVSVPKWTFP